MNELSGQECERRWKILTSRQRRVPAASSSTAASVQATADDDPFDCSDLVVPTSQGLVEPILKEFAKRWKHLEDRKVDTASSSASKGIDGDGSSRKRRRQDEPIRWGWHANRLRLPDHFDYASRQTVPPEDNGGSGDRVVSLEDPSVHLSYEKELWDLFRNVPTLETLEEAAVAGASCPHMRSLGAEMQQVVKKYDLVDCYALSRLRVSDCHGLPYSAGGGDMVTTIRLECWRRQLKRGASPDGNRLDMEFLGSQTLKDVHDVIVELSKDELWTEAAQDTAQQDSSGMFLNENTFYTTGSIDYVTPIMGWLDGSVPNPPRREYLGLPSNGPLKVLPMSSLRLDQLQWRLGVRYFHSHHGDVECSVFLTDVRQCPRSTLSSYPILYDVWTPSYSMVDCDACKHRVAVLVTSASNACSDGGPRSLCEACYQQLHPSSDGTKERTEVEKYSTWRNQGELSSGHVSKDTLF